MTSGRDMIFQPNTMDSPFMFWLIKEVFSSGQEAEEEMIPIGDREFFSLMTLVVGALGVYAVVFRLLRA